MMLLNHDEQRCESITVHIKENMQVFPDVSVQTIFTWWPFSSDITLRVGSSNVVLLHSRQIVMMSLPSDQSATE